MNDYLARQAQLPPGGWSADARKWAEESGVVAGDSGHGGQLHGAAVDVLKIRLVGLHVVAHHGAALIGVAGGLAALKGQVGVVGAAARGPRAGVPAPDCYGF